MDSGKDQKQSADRSRSSRSTGRSRQEEPKAQHSKERSTDKLCKQTDFLSNDFNPELVLQLPEDAVELPVPDAKIFNNLSEYALKSFPAKKPSTVSATKSEPAEQTDLDILRRQYEIKERMKSQIVVLDSKQARLQARQMEVKTVLSLMESDESGLGKFLNSRLRIFVRRRRKSKHPCERYACLFGQLMFFDKHWNLILSDVSETMQFVSESHTEQTASGVAASGMTDEATKRCSDGNQDASSVDWKQKKETGLSTSLISSIDNRRLLIGRNESDSSVSVSIRERHFSRLFIRGDNIIYISKV